MALFASALGGCGIFQCGFVSGCVLFGPCCGPKSGVSLPCGLGLGCGFVSVVSVGVWLGYFML